MVEVSLWRKAEEKIPNPYLLSNVVAKRIKQLSRQSAHAKKEPLELEKIALQEVIDGKLQVVTKAVESEKST